MALTTIGGGHLSIPPFFDLSPRSCKHKCMHASAVSVCKRGRNGGIETLGFCLPSSPTTVSLVFLSLCFFGYISFLFFGVMAFPASLSITAEKTLLEVLANRDVCFLCSVSTLPYSLFLLAGWIMLLHHHRHH